MTRCHGDLTVRNARGLPSSCFCVLTGLSRAWLQPGALCPPGQHLTNQPPDGHLLRPPESALISQCSRRPLSPASTRLSPLSSAHLVSSPLALSIGSSDAACIRPVCSLLSLSAFPCLVLPHRMTFPVPSLRPPILHAQQAAHCTG